jgi:DNA-binding transcriptional MerR regulator
VAVELGVKKHVLRFWEVKFPQLKPMKRGGGRRLYRPADVDLLKGIRDLLQNAGYTIKGVQRLLREQGIEQVKLAGASCSTGAAARLAHAHRPAQPTPANKATPLLLNALEIGALRTIAAELDACQAILSAAMGSDSAEARRERAG